MNPDICANAVLCLVYLGKIKMLIKNKNKKIKRKVYEGRKRKEKKHKSRYLH